MNASEKNNKNHSLYVRLISVLVVILFTFLFIEGMSRLAFAFQDQARKWLTYITPAFGWQNSLNEYQIVDREYPGHWRLRPGFNQTLEQLITSKQKSGRLLAMNYYEERAKQLEIGDDEIVIQINQDGFRGPEIDKSSPHLRILTLGDSVTFGTFEKFSYPRVLEKELKHRGIEVEVINGGVEGYRPRNILIRIEEFKALRPEITTLFIGWNELFSWEVLYSDDEVYQGLEKYLHSFRIGKQIQLKLSDSYEDALTAYNKELRPDPDAALVKHLENYDPVFIKEIEQIVNEMQSVGSQVVLVTLPGLFIMEEEPSELALEVGYVPPFTDNPYVMAMLTEQYNLALREFARQRGLKVIDLAGWGKSALCPRDAYFFDAVHLYEAGQAKVGVFMAQELYPLLVKEVTNDHGR